MDNTLVVIQKITAMFLVMLIGWLARRRSYLTQPATTSLSSFTTDIALPAMVFVKMLQTVDQDVLRQSWIIPVLAAGVLALGALVGWALWRPFCSKRQAPTFIFVVSIANWIYLPLPIVEALYGQAGVAMLLLCNIGVQVYLWTVGVAILHSGRLDRSALWALARNPGLLATVAGIVLAILGVHAPAHAPHTPWALSSGAILIALSMIGDLTIPLSLVVTGSQLGGLPLASSRPSRPLAGVVLLRLIATPLVALAAAYALSHLHLNLALGALPVLYLIATMPTAVSCSILAERFHQDIPLAAQSILYTTLLSIVTVPAMFWLYNSII